MVQIRGGSSFLYGIVIFITHRAKSAKEGCFKSWKGIFFNNSSLLANSFIKKISKLYRGFLEMYNGMKIVHLLKTNSNPWLCFTYIARGWADESCRLAGKFVQQGNNFIYFFRLVTLLDGLFDAVCQMGA